MLNSTESLFAKNWMGPGLRYKSYLAHESRCAAKHRNGSPSNSTNAFLITGFMCPCRRSIWHIIVIGTPPQTHSETGAVRLVTDEIKPLHPAPRTCFTKYKDPIYNSQQSNCYTHLAPTGRPRFGRERSNRSRQKQMVYKSGLHIRTNETVVKIGRYTSPPWPTWPAP